jgi:hypothetical protein
MFAADALALTDERLYHLARKSSIDISRALAR